MAVTLSANVDDQMAVKVRSVAEKEHRSVSNVVSSALTVFTALPKEVRDTLLEMQSQEDSAGMKRLSREMMAAASRIRLEDATERLIGEGVFGPAEHSTDEMDMLVEATRLSKARSRRLRDRPLRILLDVNIWVASLIAAARGRQGTVAQRIVAMVASGRWGEDQRPAQLVVSLEMLETIERVLRRQGASPSSVEAYVDAIKGIMKHGPEELDPYLVLGGREQLPLTDVEDAGVLATALASQASLLVTDNLDDFCSKDAVRVETRRSRCRQERGSCTL